MGGFPSGQRGQTVNLLAMPSKVRILLRPFLWKTAIGIVIAGVAELADAQDLKSCGTNLPYRFDSGRRHYKIWFKKNRVDNFGFLRYNHFCCDGYVADVMETVIWIYRSVPR